MGTRIGVAACQVPEVREDLDTALALITKYAERAWAAGARLVCFPECFLQGYLVEEEQARRSAIELTSGAFSQVLKYLADTKPMLVFGMIEIDKGILFNTAVVIDRGELIGKYRKMHLLPGEHIFKPGTGLPVFKMGDLTFGINICSDTQCPESGAAIAAQGARLIVCPSNNMMGLQKAEKWKNRHNEIRASRTKETGLWLISSDVTGICGNAIGMGPTCIINPAGHVVARAPLMKVGMVVAQISI